MGGTAGQAAAGGAQGAAESKSTFLSRIITGLLVAGGSGAVFNIFTKLKLRDPGKLAEKAQTARTEAEAMKAREEAERQAREEAAQ